MKYLLAFLIMGSIAVFVGATLGKLGAEGVSDQSLIKASHTAVTDRLRDPGSAQFRSDYVFGGGNARTVCGEFNAKNGFGGYFGFTPFIFDERTRRLTISSTDDEARDVIGACLRAKLAWLKEQRARVAPEVETAKR